MEKYNPRPPDFFEYEDCYDMKTIIESRSGCIRSMTYKHPIKERVYILLFVFYSYFTLFLNMLTANNKMK